MLLDLKLNKTDDCLSKLRNFGFRKEPYTENMVYRKSLKTPWIELEIIVDRSMDLIRMNFIDNKHNKINVDSDSKENKKAEEILEELKKENIFIENNLELNKEEIEVSEKINSLNDN